MDWFELLSPIVRDIVIAIVMLIVGIAAKKWQSIAIENEVKDLIVDAVLYVQEKYWDYQGEQKFEEAKLWIVQQLNERGIPVDLPWIEALIDATVKRLREELYDTWYPDEEYEV